ncbi:MAG: hypothetical protein P8X62_05295 [Flavobacteriaceae bacterium]
MKTTTNRFFTAIVVMLLLFNFQSIQAQDDSNAGPEYYTVTTMHWNMDNEDFDRDTWIAVEKEYLDKVTKKNEYIMAASVYMHRMSPDNTELIVVNAYGSWDDIDKAANRNGELAREAWPDSEERSAYFNKRNAYYANEHSDEIYAVMSGSKNFSEAPTKDMILYWRTNHFAFPEDGSNEEFKETRDEYLENVIHKNEYVKAYFPFAHAYGADRTEYGEAFFFESMSDMEKMFDRNGELFRAHWDTEEARKAYGEKAGKYYTGVHGDAIYTHVLELSK